MRRGLLSLLLVVLVLSVAVGVAEKTELEDVVDDDDLLVEEEETPETTDAKPVQEIDPRLTPDVIEKILSKSSAKCRKQVQENPTDVSKVSDRCRAEISSRIQRYLVRLDKEENGKTEDKKKNENLKKKKKRRSRKSKKQTRAQREAASKQKKEEEYQKTLQIIVGFVVTLVVVIASAMFFINRKLKGAGMYFPDPDAKATCCN
ncbi:unnamed protein product [Peronospora destructor]|uniref:Uncharacterized protein n=1 Tax=Peronospora destructor TaxID=86335 RepID=A0AAV0UBW0_9STRA|nr:unnamed protein product [Peronospora destructor]